MFRHTNFNLREEKGFLVSEERLNFFVKPVVSSHCVSLVRWGADPYFGEKEVGGENGGGRNM